MTHKQFLEQTKKEFRELFPISIDYPSVSEMEVFIQMEIDPKIKNEEIEYFLEQKLTQIIENYKKSVRVKTGENGTKEFGKGFDIALYEIEEKDKKYWE